MLEYTQNQGPIRSFFLAFALSLSLGCFILLESTDNKDEYIIGGCGRGRETDVFIERLLMGSNYQHPTVGVGDLVMCPYR